MVSETTGQGLWQEPDQHSSSAAGHRRLRAGTSNDEDCGRYLGVGVNLDRTEIKIDEDSRIGESVLRLSFSFLLSASAAWIYHLRRLAPPVGTSSLSSFSRLSPCARAGGAGDEKGSVPQRQLVAGHRQGNGSRRQ
uniref:Uncharacterized protein n=1 Tax=Arundo donax TaxID=35708 RepID=A0A0A8ZTJ4_ARUDO